MTSVLTKLARPLGSKLSVNALVTQTEYGRFEQLSGAINGKSAVAEAIELLRKLGTNAHVWLPGVGQLNGLETANYLLSDASTGLAPVDQYVGRVNDAIGNIDCIQPTTANKPKLVRGAVNQLLWSNDLSNVVWNKTAVSVSGSILTTSTITAELYELYTVTAGQVLTFAVSARRGTMTNAKFGIWNVQGGSAIVPATSYYSSINGTDYSIVATTFTVPVGCTNIGCYPLWNSGVTGTTDIRAAALFQGTYTAAQIQALGGIPLTTTAPASTALGPYAWQFDGVNDSLSLGSVPFQMNDDHAVIAGANYASTSANKAIASVASNSATYAKAAALTTTATNTLTARWTSNVPTDYSVTTPIVAGTTYVASARKVSNTGDFRLNSVSKGNVDLTGVTATFNAGYIGFEGGANAAAVMNGNIHCVFAIKATLTDAELLLLERLAGNLSGVQL